MAQSTSAAPEIGSPSGTEQVKEKASEMAGQAQEKAQDAKQQAKNQLRDQLDRRSNDAGEKVIATANDMRSVGEHLRSQGKEQPAKLADQAAERAEKLGGYLSGSDADRILSDIEGTARRQPWVVVAGGVALGFVASRFLKASSSERYRSPVAAGSAAPRELSPPQLENGHGHRTSVSVGTGMHSGDEAAS
jgi:hypothetical protein